MAGSERLTVRDRARGAAPRFRASDPGAARLQTVDPGAPFSPCSAVMPKSSRRPPGFGNSPRPKDFDTVYDLVHLYLAVLDALPGDKATCSGFRSAAGSRPRSPPRAAIGSTSWSSSIRSASRSATARHPTSSTSSTNRPTRCGGAAGTTRTALRPITTRCRTRRWSSTPATARRCASMPGTPTCTTRNCRAGSAGSRCRPWCCGARAIGSSPRITAAPTAG